MQAWRQGKGFAPCWQLPVFVSLTLPPRLLPSSASSFLQQHWSPVCSLSNAHRTSLIPPPPRDTSNSQASPRSPAECGVPAIWVLSSGLGDTNAGQAASLLSVGGPVPEGLPHKAQRHQHKSNSNLFSEFGVSTPWRLPSE